MVVVHKHTQYPGPGRNDHNVVGNPLGPGLRGQGQRPLLHRLRCIAAHGRLLHHQPDLALGTVQSVTGVRGTQPDWYMGFLTVPCVSCLVSSETSISSTSSSATC